jgi:tripartite ATP-independent transporter DctM subunit
MSDPDAAAGVLPSPLNRPAWVRTLCLAENSLIVMALALTVALPVLDIVLRTLLRGGVSGSIPFVQHFTLAVGMLGGALAARENRLLALSPLTNYLKGRGKTFALVFSHAFAAGISGVLAHAGWQFLQAEKTQEKILAYGIPVWGFQFLLAAGFAAIALRLVWNASDRWRWRALTLLLAACLLAIGVKAPVDPARLVVPAFAVLAVATVLGAPIFTTLGGAAMILFWGEGRPLTSMPNEHYYLVTNPILPTLPLFTLAGYFLAEGGASKRLIRLFQALFGSFRGGPAIVTTLICAFFTAFTGASGVTILALGGLLMPVLLSAQYPERKALGFFTSAGSLGLLFPPSLPLILYAIIANNTIANLGLPPEARGAEVTINRLFLAGLIPGVLQVLLTVWWGLKMGPKRSTSASRFDASEALRALWEAKWEVMLPVVTLGSLLSGFATPVEAAAVTALFALATQTLAHRELKIFRDGPRVMTECGLLVGGVLLILGVAMGLTNFLVYAEVPTKGAEWVAQAIHSKLVFLLLLNVLLLFVGCLMDIFSAIVVVVPLIVPMGMAFGVDPLHMGIVFLANMELGFLTPPVGMNLFLASYRFNKPMTEVSRSVIPMLLVRFVGVLLITYLPVLSTALPRWFM